MSSSYTNVSRIKFLSKGGVAGEIPVVNEKFDIPIQEIRIGDLIIDHNNHIFLLIASQLEFDGSMLMTFAYNSSRWNRDSQLESKRFLVFTLPFFQLFTELNSGQGTNNMFDFVCVGFFLGIAVTYFSIRYAPRLRSGGHSCGTCRVDKTLSKVSYSICATFRDGNKQIYHNVGAHEFLVQRNGGRSDFVSKNVSGVYDTNGKLVVKVPFNFIKEWWFLSQKDHFSKLETEDVNRILDFIVTDAICWINAPPDLKLLIAKLKEDKK